jgi:signal transduction histidine kinase
VLDVDGIKKLTGTTADLKSPEYALIKKQLSKMQKASDGVRFVYLTGYRDGSIFFFADSEPADSPDYSPPGQIYTEASPNFINVFLNKKSFVEGPYSDRWGTWVSGLVPITDPATGEVVAVMGMDSSASTYYQTVYLYSSFPAVGASFVILLIVIVLIIRKREQKTMALQYELVSIASHEIRSPLTGIRWAIYSLMEETSPTCSPEHLAAMKQIKESSDRLLDTINDLLDVSTASQGYSSKKDWQPVDVKLVIDDVVKACQLETQKNSLEIVFDKSFTSAFVFGDQDKFKRLFGNLLTNAIKYSEANSTITIGCDQKEDNWVFWVKDQGIGIPEKEQKKVFNGFYRADNAKSKTNLGTGLGLYYVKQIVESHKGKIWFESKENVGTTFFVQFPEYKK